MVKWLLLAIAVMGCDSKPKGKPERCEDLDAGVVEKLIKEWQHAHPGMPQTADPKSVLSSLAATCSTWPAGTIDCLRSAGTCTSTKVEATRDAVRAQLDSILRTHGAPPDSDGGLAENGPHPDYPTPIAAGTANIFFLEEPDRGPRAPATFRMPARSSLIWTEHALCEVGRTSIACSAAASGQMRWRVGRKSTEVVAEMMFGDRLITTYVFITRPDGTPIQRLEIDPRGRVAAALMFVNDRFSGRLRHGGNALEGCGYYKYKLDANKRIAETSCLQWLGEPMLDTKGIATYRYKRNPAGFIIEETRFGIDDKPLDGNDGAQKKTYDLDGSGRTKLERFFNLDGKRAGDADGCFGLGTEYDTDGLETRRICLDASDKPRGRIAGISIHENLYDGRGCLIGTRYLDPVGKPTSNPDLVHGEDLVVNKYCETTRRTCLDVRGDPLACGPDHPARYDTVYDSAGNAISTTHHAADGHATRDEQFDSYEVRGKFDAVGNQISLSCFDEGGAKIECNGTGFHEKRSTYDDAGHRTGEKFISTDGRPAGNLGAASRKFRFDNYDHQVESQSFDEHGQLFEMRGAAIIRELYDVRHMRFGIVLLDKDGKPATYTACFTGTTCPERAWHAVRIVRIGDGTVEYNQFFDEAGQLIEAVNCRANKCFD